MGARRGVGASLLRGPGPELRESKGARKGAGAVGGGSIGESNDQISRHRCKMQSSGRERSESESLFLERIPRCVATKVEVEHSAVPLPSSTPPLPLASSFLLLSLQSLSSSSATVAAFTSARRVAVVRPPAASTDSLFPSASTRECVKQNETRVPAPCRLSTRSFLSTAVVFRSEGKSCSDRYRSATRLPFFRNLGISVARVTDMVSVSDSAYARPYDRKVRPEGREFERNSRQMRFY